jgi:putative ABC transport system permease protein
LDLSGFPGTFFDRFLGGVAYMHLMQGVLIALKELWAHKLRTFLTLLGNIVGVMSIIAIVSIIDGANSYIEGRMAGAG